MKSRLLILLALTFLAAACQNPPQQEKAINSENKSTTTENPAARLIGEMVAASGGLERYQQLKDVEYTYTYRDVATGKQDISLERYVYEGELSWAKYTEHTQGVFPEQPKEVLQGYDGRSAWVSLNGELLSDPQAIGMARFLRKTNFYWLNMMYKLLDPGTQYEQKADRTVKGIDYKVVEVSFGADVGDAQDTYLLYLNPETKLVDQFLFTVMEFNHAEPLLMEVKYEKVNGLQWPTYRRYAQSNWEGVLVEDATWTEEISQNLRFDNGFETAMFVPPTVEN